MNDSYRLAGVGTYGAVTTITPIRLVTCLECGAGLHESSDGNLSCPLRYCPAFSKSVDLDEQDMP